MNQEQYNILLQGVNEWNALREEYPNDAVNLEGADLEGADLDYINLEGADLRGAILDWS